MTEVGDKGVVMDTFGDKVFVPLADTLNVGDSVAVYNLVDDTRIAVPILAFDIGDYAFVTPSFDFAGFDWKLDFDFNLIPLDMSFAALATQTWTKANFRTTATHWFGGGEEYPAGTYRIFVQGWYSNWSTGSVVRNCGGTPTPCIYPAWCYSIHLMRGADEDGLTKYMVDTHLQDLNSWGWAEFNLYSPAKIGLAMRDSAYSDNRGAAQYNLFYIG